MMVHVLAPARWKRLTRVAWQPWAWSLSSLLAAFKSDFGILVVGHLSLTRTQPRNFCAGVNRLGFAPLSGPASLLKRLICFDVALT